MLSVFPCHPNHPNITTYGSTYLDVIIYSLFNLSIVNICRPFSKELCIGVTPSLSAMRRQDTDHVDMPTTSYVSRVILCHGQSVSQDNLDNVQCLAENPQQRNHHHSLNLHIYLRPHDQLPLKDLLAPSPTATTSISNLLPYNYSIMSIHYTKYRSCVHVGTEENLTTTLRHHEQGRPQAQGSLKGSPGNQLTLSHCDYGMYHVGCDR